MELKVTNLYLCEILWGKNLKKNEHKIDEIIQDFKSWNDFSAEQIQIIRKILSKKFISSFNNHSKSVRGSKDLFKEKYNTFLQNYFVNKSNELINKNVSFLNNIEISNTSESNESCPEQMIRKLGRPRLAFEKGSNRTKKRRASEIAHSFSIEELEEAIKLKRSRLITEPEGPLDDQSENEEVDQENSDVLAMYVDLDLTQRKYKTLKYHEKNLNNSTLPSYNCILKEKNFCYPEHITITESGASVNLFSLLEHTMKRIFQCLTDEELKKINNHNLVLFGKWGMDGASAQQSTRQKYSGKDFVEDNNLQDSFENNESNKENKKTDNEFSDKSVYSICFVPLMIKSDNVIIWNNERPSSIHYCRPIKFNFVKEKDEMVKKEYEYYNNLINKVQKYCFDFEGITYEVTLNLQLTMIDGKICNIITGQKASTCCNICKVSPKNINNLEYIKKLPFHSEYYRFGLSTLHCWIKCMEYLLHISYNLGFKKSCAKGKNKLIKKEKKAEVQAGLKLISITVDVVRQGCGTSNTGNVARSFFAKAKEVSKITGINEEAITRLHNILQVVTCGKNVDCIKFNDYCLQTAKLFTKEYYWYNMPPSVHKLLIHGPAIIESLPLAIGKYSEESQEASNKIFRKARLGYSRMTDRKSTNEDIIHYQLIHSDPVINIKRKKITKKHKPLSEEAEKLLI